METKDTNDLITFSKRIASEWHPIKNGNLTPLDVTSKSSRKVWWKCSKGHEWQATVASRTSGGGCPVCVKNEEKETL